MIKFFLILLNLISFYCLSQQNQGTNQSNQSKAINKWINATISLENRSYCMDTSSYLDSAWESIKKDKIDGCQYIRIHDSISKIYSSVTGSAIFFKYKSERYLITATHVIRDYSDTTEIKISKHIYIVPNENNFSRSTPFNSHLFLVSPWEFFYYVPEDIDISIIALDFKHGYSRIADALEKTYGYIPITIKDIDTACRLSYGQDIMAVGYPFFSNFGEKNKLNDTTENWVSKYLYQPVVTFGKIASISKFKPYFFGDVNVMPGNSGGAIVSNNKLIGIVSKQGRRKIETIDGRSYADAYYRIPYIAIIVKIPFLIKLLERERYRENHWPL